MTASSQTPDTPPPAQDDTPAHGSTPVSPVSPSDFAADDSAKAGDAQPTGSDTSLVPARPRHPMPTHFPEIQMPVSEPRRAEPRPIAVPPMLPDPHSIHDGSAYAPEHSVCVRCGSSNLARGQVIDHGDKFRDLHFAPRRLSLRRLNSLLNLMPFRSLVKLNALACRDCGAVLLVADTNELRRAERRRE